MKNIDETERKYILKDLGQSGQKITFKEIPWLQILQNVSFIGLCLTGFCQGINDFIMLEMMPQYLSHVKVSFTLWIITNPLDFRSDGKWPIKCSSSNHQCYMRRSWMHQYWLYFTNNRNLAKYGSKNKYYYRFGSSYSTHLLVHIRAINDFFCGFCFYCCLWL